MAGQGRIKLVVDVAVFADDSVLLVKYKDVRKYDGETGWFLPDDFLRHGEHPEAAGRRILRQQIGATRVALRLGFVESFANGAWHIVFHYLGKVATRIEPKRGSNVSEAKWFHAEKPPKRSEVGHGGWALSTIDALRRAPRVSRSRMPATSAGPSQRGTIA